MDFLWRMEYRAGQLKAIAPASFRYKFKTDIQLGMTAKQFFGASQESPLHDILPEEVNAGEIIEIDDGLQPYYFYVLDFAEVSPLRYFRLPEEAKAITGHQSSQRFPK